MYTSEGLRRFTSSSLAPDSRNRASSAGTKRALENE